MSFAESAFAQTAKTLNESNTEFEKALTGLAEVQIDGGKGIDPDKPLSYVDVPLALFVERLKTMPTLLAAFPGEVPLASVPIQHITGMRDAAQQVKTLIDELARVVTKIQKSGGFKPTTWSNIQVTNLGGTISEDLVQKFLQPILKRTDQFLLHYHHLLAAMLPGSLDFQNAIKKAVGIESVATNAAQSAQEAAQKAQAEAAATTENSAKAQSHAAIAQENEAATKKIRDDLAAIEGDARSKKSEAETTMAGVIALKAQVTEYAATFEAFQKSLNERNATWATGQQRLDQLVTDLNQQEDGIAETIQRANRMLATATNAGLTAAQEEKYNALANDLRWAGYGVYVSYGLLFLSLSPLAAYVIGNWHTTIPFSGGLEYVANVFLRVFLLLPSLLFVGFTTRRYRRLFRLKHDYGFRASLAGAVEGFKSQAPEHGEAIAAVAFYQLGRNPAEAIDGDPEEPSWYTKLLEIIEQFGDRFGKKKEPTAS